MNENEFKNSFKIPENYFNQLNDEIFLNNLKEKDTYKVPTNYFEELEQKVLSNAETKSETKIFHFNYWWAAACVLLLALVAIPVLMNNTKENEKEIVDSKVENAVYEKIYDTYIVTDQNKKSSKVTLDDSDFVLYDY